MADWIKVEITSSQKIEVLTIADILDIDEHMVFGKLVILWCWADANTVDGHADNVTKRMVDRVVSHKGFADALLDTRVGWLKEDGKDGVFFPNFDRHNGKGAKKRATDARRKASHRAGVANKSEDCHTESVTDTVTREEKIREDKKDLNTSCSLTPKAVDCPHQEIVDAYHESLPSLTRMRSWNGDRPKNLRARWREDSERQSIDWWKSFFVYVSKSDFLMGRAQQQGERGIFQASLDWIIKPTNFNKIIEGRYHK